MNARTQRAATAVPERRKMGRPPLKAVDRSKSFTIRLRPETRDWIEREGARLGLAPGVFTRHALEALKAAHDGGKVEIRPAGRQA